ncbi:ATP-binding protein [Pandoraea bronchicola]|uniref:histidine kinase n=1 Tax=Pandoraea bronchicola TaxID=2508287 RepID=A0A5E5BKU0_9BURK|nr:ATP-binding protein [Pandoraea bronchicola]VVE86871.1 two-component sensor histidine kinase [Pandoraea bronchicola]
MSARILDTAFYRLFFVMVALVAGTQSIAVFMIRQAYGVDTFVPMKGMSYGAMWAYALLIQFGPALISSWLGAKMLTRPFRSIASGAEDLSRSIDAAPIPETGPREARQAARVFNRMQDAIRRQVSERSRFLAAVSHDLRTPLTRMTLRLRAARDPELREQLADDIREMTQLLDATLAFLRNEEVVERFCPVDIDALADAIAQDAAERNERVTVTGSTMPIMAQPLALKRCLTNLVANAIRYGETAHIHLTDSPEQLKIEVTDEGPGIPDAQLTRVLEPFFRLEDSRSKGTGGVGLGLTIASDVARRHGGRLVLRNSPGGGLVAQVTMPRA